MLWHGEPVVCRRGRRRGHERWLRPSPGSAVGLAWVHSVPEDGRASVRVRSAVLRVSARVSGVPFYDPRVYACATASVRSLPSAPGRCRPAATAPPSRSTPPPSVRAGSARAGWWSDPAPRGMCGCRGPRSTATPRSACVGTPTRNGEGPAVALGGCGARRPLRRPPGGQVHAERAVVVSDRAARSTGGAMCPRSSRGSWNRSRTGTRWPRDRRVRRPRRRCRRGRRADVVLSTCCVPVGNRPGRDAEPGRHPASSSYMTHTEFPTPLASGLLEFTATRTRLPGMLVFDVLNIAVPIPARAASTAPPCQATSRPPFWTQCGAPLFNPAPGAL